MHSQLIGLVRITGGVHLLLLFPELSGMPGHVQPMVHWLVLPYGFAWF